MAMIMIMIMMTITIAIMDTEELFTMLDGKVFQSVGGCYGKRSCTVCLQIKMRNNSQLQKRESTEASFLY